jgi:hypothetical protein
VSEQLRADDRWFAEIDRRLRTLEATARVGLSGLRSVWQTAGASPTTFGAWETGTASNTWTDDTGATGTGYPTLTLTLGSRYMIFWSARPIGLANAATYRSLSVQLTVGIDGVFNPPLPSPRRLFANSNALPVDLPIAAIVARSITPGQHTFQVAAQWTNDVPAAGNQPTLTDTFLGILPLSSS